MNRITQDVNVVGLVKGAERYVFRYVDSERQNLLRAFGRMACDPELSFSWYDAAVMSKKSLEQWVSRGKPT